MPSGSLIAWGIIAALYLWFRGHLNQPSATWEWLGRRAYAVYIIHPPVLVGISLLLHRWVAPALAKFAVVGALACIDTWLLAESAGSPVLGVQVETRVAYRLTEVGQRVFLSNRWESIGGISCSRMQRFQKMLCIQTRCHKLRSFVDHHRENLFTALVNYCDLVEVDNAVSR